MAQYGLERFLGIRYAFGPSFSHDGREIAFVANITGVPQAWAVPVEGGWPDQRTFYQERVGRATFSPVDDRMIFSMDAGGNERIQLFLARADGSEVWPLSKDADRIHAFGGWRRDGKAFAFAANTRNPAYFDVYVQSSEPGSIPRRVFEHDGNNYAVGFTPDGASLLVTQVHAPMQNDLYLVDADSGEARQLTPGRGTSLHTGGVFTADGRGLYLITDHERDFDYLAYLDLASGEFTPQVAPDWDVEALAITRDGKRLAYTVNVGGASELHVLDLEAGGIERRLPPRPRGVMGGLTWDPEGNRLAFAFTGGRYNMDVWLLDLESNEYRQVTHSARGGIPQSTFAEADPVAYESFDGRSIPAFLFRPPGAGDGPLPVVIYVHGGPESQTRAEFNPILQYLVHRGFAVLAPNVRGSTGYGKAFTHLDDVRKRMDSVTDLAHAALWLKRSGVGDPDRIAVMGGSYGGFMVLAAVTHHPELWAAGVDIVGIANLETFLENTGPWRRKLREAEYGSLETDRAFLREISPIHHAERIQAPLMVVHGANDPRVPVDEAEQIVAKVKSGGGDVQYLRFEDEGHGIVKLPNRIKAYTAIAAFLDRHLSDRA